MNNPTQTKLIVATEVNSCRLDKFISQSLETYSRNAIQQFIIDSLVTINGQVTTSRKALVQPGDVIQVTIQESDSLPVISPNSDISLDIVYEDEWLAIINKPAGLVMHPGCGTTEQTLSHALLGHYGANDLSYASTVKPGIVNRLDKDTSGLVIIAKSDHAHNLLSSQLKERTIKKTYLALVHGSVKSPIGTICTKIAKCNKNHRKMRVTDNRGLDAITKYRILGKYGDISLLQCQIETGRTHQIRLHMLHQGHPILGDTLYSNGYNLSATKYTSDMLASYNALHRQALHSYKLEFAHPMAPYNLLEFSAQIPNDMRQIIDHFSNVMW